MYKQLELVFEEWRPVVGYEGWYEVSNLGRARRVKPMNGARLGKCLAIVNEPTGYVHYHLSKDGVDRTIHVHTMVALAFIGPRPPKMEINHRDGVKTNNRLENLEYVTSRENTMHSFDVLGQRERQPRGEKHYKTRLTEAQVRDIKFAELGRGGQTRLAERYGVTIATISAIRLGKVWQHID